MKCNLLTSNNKGMEYDIYQICLSWCLIVVIFIFFCASAFLKTFHSIGVCKSPHSPSKNSWTCPCGIDGHSMEILFVLPCHSPFFHTKSRFENGDFVGFWTSLIWDLGIHPMIIWLSKICPTRKEPMSKPISMDKTCITPTCLQTLISIPIHNLNLTIGMCIANNHFNTQTIIWNCTIYFFKRILWGDNSR